MTFDLENKKIISFVADDCCKFWVFSLTKNIELINSTNSYELFFSEKHDFYILNLTHKNFNSISSFVDKIIKKNFLHFILSDFDDVKTYINYFDEIDNNNFSYSLLNYFSEILYDDDPIDLTKLKNVRYFFASTNALSKNNKIQSSFIESLGRRYVLDYKYSLIYFYFKLGFCYFQKGKHLFENCRRQDKVFMYSKSKDPFRQEQIKMALDTGKIYEKKFDNDDWYWYQHNYNNYHIPFIIDYNICKINIVIETNPISYDGDDNLPYFLSEKTLKAIMVPTPSYVLLQKRVYDELIRCGFYFLNVEFGDQGIKNYREFCLFLKNCSENDINDLYHKTKSLSEKNKELLETYIFSDKTREIEMLFNTNF